LKLEIVLWHNGAAAQHNFRSSLFIWHSFGVYLAFIWHLFGQLFNQEQAWQVSGNAAGVDQA
jgi:hypothetical protein